MKLDPRLVRASAGVAVAFMLAAGSGGIQREGPELGVYAQACGPDGNEACYAPRLNGGFPFGYLFDVPGGSVEGLSLAEDEFRLLPFVGDMAVYFAALFLSWAFGRFRRQLRRESRAK